MSEKIIMLDDIDPVDIYGVNDAHLNLIAKHFSKLKIVARGHEIKVAGEADEIELFEAKIKLLTDYYVRNGAISERALNQILSAADESQRADAQASDDVIVYGPNGIVVKPRTPNQRKIGDALTVNDLVFAIGPAGTGKTYTAVAHAVKALKNKEVRKIVVTRPAVEAGENLGFLPGDLKEKLDPYLQPLYDAMRDMIPPEKLKIYMETGIIQIAPLAFMRGRTLDHAFVILDEAQNATQSQIKMFLTRMGRSSKFVLTGDITQVDLPMAQPSGLIQAITILKNISGISFIYLDNSDIMRHSLVKKIVNAYESK